MRETFSPASRSLPEAKEKQGRLAKSSHTDQDTAIVAPRTSRLSIDELDSANGYYMTGRPRE